MLARRRFLFHPPPSDSLPEGFKDYNLPHENRLYIRVFAQSYLSGSSRTTGAAEPFGAAAYIIRGGLDGTQSWWKRLNKFVANRHLQSLTTRRPMSLTPRSTTPCWQPVESSPVPARYC